MLLRVGLLLVLVVVAAAAASGGVWAWQCSDCQYSPPQCVTDSCGFGTCACNDHGVLSHTTGACQCEESYAGLDCEVYVNPIGAATCALSDFGPIEVPGQNLNTHYNCSTTKGPSCANGTTFNPLAVTPAAHFLSLPESPCVPQPPSLTQLKIGSSEFVVRQTAGNRYFATATAAGGDWFLLQPVLSGSTGAHDFQLLNPAFHFLYLGIDLSNTTRRAVQLLSTDQNGPRQVWRLASTQSPSSIIESVALPGYFLSVSTQKELVVTPNKSLANSFTVSLNGGNNTCSIPYYFSDCLPPRHGPYYFAAAAAGSTPGALLTPLGLGEAPTFGPAVNLIFDPPLWEFFQIDQSNEVLVTSHPVAAEPTEHVLIDSVLTVSVASVSQDTVNLEMLETLYQRDASTTFLLLPVDCATGAFLSQNLSSSTLECFVLQVWRLPWVHPDLVTVSLFLVPGASSVTIATGAGAATSNASLAWIWRALPYAESREPSLYDSRFVRQPPLTTGTVYAPSNPNQVIVTSNDTSLEECFWQCQTMPFCTTCQFNTETQTVEFFAAVTLSGKLSSNTFEQILDRPATNSTVLTSSGVFKPTTTLAGQKPPTFSTSCTCCCLPGYSCAAYSLDPSQPSCSLCSGCAYEPGYATLYFGPSASGTGTFSWNVFTTYYIESPTYLCVDGGGLIETGIEIVMGIPIQCAAPSTFTPYFYWSPTYERTLLKLGYTATFQWLCYSSAAGWFLKSQLAYSSSEPYCAFLV